MNLQQQCKQFNIVINKQKEINEKALNSYLENNCISYAWIKHDKDVNVETAELKKVHYHAILCLPKRKRALTILYELQNALSIDSVGIQIEQLKSLEGSIQYLIHLNDSNKTQYDKELINTNFSKDELDILLSTTNDTLSFDSIYRLCYNSHSILDVIKGVGFVRYNMYRSTIKDIYDYVQKTKQAPF